MRFLLAIAVLMSFSVCRAVQNPEKHGKTKGRKPAVASCRLTEEGSVGGEWKNLRLEKNGQAIAGTDRFEDLAAAVQQLLRSGQCHPVEQNCELRSEGNAAGAWRKHRIFVDGAPVTGANDLGTLQQHLEALRTLGFCGDRGF